MKKSSIILGSAYFIFLHIILFFPFDINRKIPKNNLTIVSDLHKKYDDNFQRKMIAFQSRKSENASRSSIYLFGDSIIQGFNENLLSINALNFGIGNETISQLTQRLDNYSNIDNIKGILLLTGHNDLEDSTPESTLNRYKTLIDKLPRDKVIVHAVLNVYEANKKLSKLNTKINYFNLLLRNFCIEQNIKYLNVNSELNEGGQLKQNYQIGDGVHLNAQGNKILARELNKNAF
jgi:hypothetical protein